MDSNWDASLQTLKGVGVKRAQLFEKLGVHSVGALLRYYPRAYEDWSVVTPLGRAALGETACVRATVLRPVKEHYIRKGMVLYKTQAADGPVRLDLTFFNNRFVLDSLRAGEEYLFYGKVEGNLVGRSMVSPAFASAASPPGLRPIYRQTEGLPSRAIAAAVKQALDRVDDIIGDPLPEELCKQHGLCHLRFALQNIHFPPSPDALAIARRRLVFEELLTSPARPAAAQRAGKRGVRAGDGARLHRRIFFHASLLPHRGSAQGCGRLRRRPSPFRSHEPLAAG